jgi:hypothetical protein
VTEKTPKSPEEYAKERNQTLDIVLGLINDRLAKLPVVFLASPSADIAPQVAERESWLLISSAVQHLKEGGPVIGEEEGKAIRAPGLLTTALSKASLRHSSLASSLGVAVPQFEQTLLSVAYDNGNDEAYFLCKRLIEATAGDIAESEKIIRAKITKAGGAGMTSATGDDMLDKIFDAVKKGAPSPLSAPTGNILNDGAAFAIQEQMENTCIALVAAHRKSCDEMMKDLETLVGGKPTPGFRKKPGTYKL